MIANLIINPQAADATAQLRAASIFGDAETAQASIAAGADVDAKGKRGATPLRHAANRSRIEKFITLAELGADLRGRVARIADSR